MTAASPVTHREHMQCTLFPRCHALLRGKIWLQVCSTKQLFKNSNTGLAPALRGLVRPLRMSCSSACNLTLGKSFKGVYSHEFDHVVVKYGTGPRAKRKKNLTRRRKKTQNKLKPPKQQNNPTKQDSKTKQNRQPKATLLASGRVCNADI